MCVSVARGNYCMQYHGGLRVEYIIWRIVDFFKIYCHKISHSCQGKEDNTVDYSFVKLTSSI